MGRKPKDGTFASKLKFYRQNSGLTQKQVADALHIERTTYTYYENGKTLPNIITLKKLSKIFNVPIEYLIPSEVKDSKEVEDSDFSSVKKMEEEAQQPSARKISDEKIYCLSKEEQSLLINYRALPEEGKNEIFENIREITEKYKNMSI